MMVNSIRAEWTKLASTKSFAWTSILIVVLSWAFAALMGWGSKSALDSMDPEDMTDVPAISAVTAVQGFELFGVMVIIIMATLLVTTEYRFKTINETIMMTPKRPIIVVSKTIVYGLVAVVLSFFSTITSVLVFKWLAGDYGSAMKMFSGSSARVYVSTAVEALLVVVMAVGVAFIVRQTAGAIAIMLLWKLVLEDLITLIPKVGTHIKGYRPFANLNAWVGDGKLDGAPWGTTGGVIYFAVWALVLFAIGVAVFVKRDA
ncbi:ABC transporter permease [Corynebacterium pseudokroppenstedtii]|uniref:ABC transporter permease n=1 Tax=Corynebacterium pseudokroppenstedtii TaxID=2804917 RepID=A0AAU0PYZ9_9CORY|nr:ABC transporter permease [Corynebacterium pseudokroppenstedtii]MDU6478569.1 ABC transporter permease [Corynebacterium kroppenstedtii]MBY0791425.1 ABC transporter permease [Corynebacterium pseudokroppenstedtii]MCF6794038.1 ABC transporter permease [Corynebacterium pseudokroppenstedtii]MCF8703440.1 ABC transporter permease [Corynebacterium pseudokroppenstedtii]MCG2637026.1 ABC transporter permease [Corynebacterium pseudokroppenstedtii]